MSAWGPRRTLAAVIGVIVAFAVIYFLGRIALYLWAAGFLATKDVETISRLWAERRE